MKILEIAAEVAPFAKTGGLADVASALPQALAKRGHEVIVVMPKYKMFVDGKHTSEPYNKCKTVVCPIAGTKVSARIEVTRFPGTDIPVFLLARDGYYKRDGIYVDKKAKPWPDNAARFAFFSRAALEIARIHWEKVDIVHAHDWHAAPSTAYLKVNLNNDPAFADTRSLYTVHNLAYQGDFPLEEKATLGLPDELYEEKAEKSAVIWGKINYMKTGLEYADHISTVSKKYSEEIKTPEFGCGLEQILQRRSKDLTGILNGVDYSEWSPEADPFIPVKFSLNDMSGKAANKCELQKKANLAVDPNVPLIGVVSRLADQKGFDLIETIFPDMMALGIQFVLLGTGEERYHKFFNTIAAKFPGRVGITLGFSNPMAHLIEAGSDMFLMPSHYEPCGLNQMYSLRYGTVPIVRSTGGLADTIRDYNADKSTGNGFSFEPAKSEECLDAVTRALNVYKNDKAAWKEIVKRGMQEDHSWDASAREYEALFESMLRER